MCFNKYLLTYFYFYYLLNNKYLHTSYSNIKNTTKCPNNYFRKKKASQQQASAACKIELLLFPISRLPG